MGKREKKYGKGIAKIWKGKADKRSKGGKWRRGEKRKFRRIRCT